MIELRIPLSHIYLLVEPSSKEQTQKEALGEILPNLLLLQKRIDR